MIPCKLRLIVSTDVRRLLEAAADGFLRPFRSTPQDPFPSPDYLLALRQGGVRDDLIRIAAAKGCTGWFDPPLCIFHELPRWLGEARARALSDVERIALLGDVVRSVGRGIFERPNGLHYFLDALDSFFGELVAEGLSPDRFETVISSIHAEDGSFRARKNAELSAIYAAYIAEMERLGVRDSRANLVASAKLIAEDSSGLAARLRGRREIRLFGLADLRGGWRKLLTALHESPAVDTVGIYATCEFSERELSTLPPVEVENLRSQTPIAASLFRKGERSTQSESRGIFSVIEAPNTERELEEVALRVRHLADEGVPLHRIGVVARTGRPYLELVVRSLRLVGVPATARLRIGFNEIPVIKSLLCLLAAASEGWTRSGLVEVASLPHFLPLLDSRVINSIGYRRSVRSLDAWERAIARMLHEAEIESSTDSDSEHGSRSLPDREQLETSLENFATFRNFAESMDGKRELREWIEWLERFLEEDPLEIENRMFRHTGSDYEPIRRDLAGWRGLEIVLHDWNVAVSNWGDTRDARSSDTPKISVAEFSKRLRELLDGQVGIWTETQRGVQVIEALAAAYREFDHVFLVGMDAGSFPVPPPRSPILDDEDRNQAANERLHLDTRRDWDARERELFRAVVSGASHLTVSYPVVAMRGAETIRSAFVEALVDAAEERKQPVDQHAVITDGMPLVNSRAAQILAGHAAAIEHSRSQAQHTRFSGVLEDRDVRDWLRLEFNDDRLWSPSQIEAYAKCPWAFFSSRLLKAEMLREPDEDMEATVRGDLLHATLARFYDGARKKTDSPVFLMTSDLEWALPDMVRALDAEFQDMEQRVWMGHPLLRDAKRAELKRELCRYLEWEAEFHERINDRKKKDSLVIRTGADSHELAFGQSGDVVLEREGIRFKFRGIIDRVDLGVDPRLADPTRFVAAIDYKSSMGGVPGGGKGTAWDEGVVLQIPLYAYALAQIRDDVAVSRVEYRPLRETKPGAAPGRARAHRLELFHVEKGTGKLTTNEEDAAKMERSLTSVCEHVLNIRNGKFPVSPAPSCGCPSFCHAYDICRVTPSVRKGRHQ